CMQVVEFPWTF
nr:immunoglobulin light chain junction region [Macaca mulatta]